MVTTIRRLLGYWLLALLPPIQTCTYQAGFVPNGSAAAAHWLAMRAIEQAHEWQKPIYIGQLDIASAFDTISKQMVYSMLDARRAPLLAKVLLGMLYETATVEVMLGPIKTGKIKLETG
eukprot:12897855-Prorocentrum_lima.AAC.1